MLPDLASSICEETDLNKIIRYADEYFIWSECLHLETESLSNEYKSKLHQMLYTDIINGHIDYLIYGIDQFYIQSNSNKDIIKKVSDIVKPEVITYYIEYLSGTTNGDQAYRYSYELRRLANVNSLKDIIFEKIDGLYNVMSFPVQNVTEQQYETSCNIMHILYMVNREKLKRYCDELKKKCDYMAAHRIDVILEELKTSLN